MQCPKCGLEVWSEGHSCLTGREVWSHGDADLDEDHDPTPTPAITRSHGGSR